MIWNNKRYEGRPMFVKSKEDSLIAKHRRWYSQFYSKSSRRLTFQKENLDWWKILPQLPHSWLWQSSSWSSSCVEENADLSKGVGDIRIRISTNEVETFVVFRFRKKFKWCGGVGNFRIRISMNASDVDELIILDSDQYQYKWCREVRNFGSGSMHVMSTS